MQHKLICTSVQLKWYVNYMKQFCVLILPKGLPETILWCIHISIFKIESIRCRVKYKQTTIWYPCIIYLLYKVQLLNVCRPQWTTSSLASRPHRTTLTQIEKSLSIRWVPACCNYGKKRCLSQNLPCNIFIFCNCLSF